MKAEEKKMCELLYWKGDIISIDHGKSSLGEELTGYGVNYQGEQYRITRRDDDDEWIYFYHVPFWAFKQKGE